MLYGKPYGDKPCSRCDSRTAVLYDECYFCGEDGCSECMDLQTDPQPGNTSSRLICGNSDCQAKAQDEAA